jgi:hypothetical protein
MFHLAGIPSYLVVAELAIHQVLRGRLPRPDYPEALRQSAPSFWRHRAAQTLSNAKNAYVQRGLLTEVAAALANTAHAVLAARGEWVINEKRLLQQAGLRGIDAIVAGLRPDPETLAHAVADAEALLEAA